ncbi:MAG: hypothetical protein K2J24_07150 [Muribaculaceae bacterium]|nr:hypothetical protein [Muribaculaceae bacterium]
MKHFLTLSFALPVALTAAAHTDLLDQNFNGEYLVDFPVVLELDHLPPIASVSPLFQNDAGVAQPWWPLKDSSSSDDRFLCSHSAYQYAGASNDWVGSRAITIPSDGFVLSFGAQSYVMRSGDRLSDLWLFITEEPLDADNLPSEPTLHIEKVGLGADPEILEGDFISYEVNLDAWTGKTVYINFANLNEDCDILAIDNVLIRRHDVAEVNIAGPGEYVVQGEYTVSAVIRGTEEPGLGAWTLTFDDGNGNTDVRTGESLAFGEEFSFEFTGVAEAGKVSEYSVSLDSADIPSIPASGSLTGLSFLPTHRVFYEESTGVWCGNCPLGAYTIESMMTDPEMKDRVVPVSIHIPGTGTDYMVNEAYVAQFGLTAAPLTRTEREEKVLGFGNLDYIYDPSNPNTAAGRLRTYADRVTTADISLSAAYSVTEVYPPHLTCEVTVRAAIDMEGQYAVGLVMTENNVTFDHPAWYQSNYASGDDIEGDMGGWTKLSSYVQGMHYQDVARGIWGYNGIDGSLPALLPMDQDITFSYELEIPDTYLELTPGDPSTAISPAINTDNVVMVAFLVDQETGFVINAVSYPMTPQAEERFTIADLIAGSGVESVATPSAEGEPEYYNLQGIRLSAPVLGQPVIVRRGNTVSKQIFR